MMDHINLGFFYFRYMATQSGVLLLHPAVVLPKSYDPVHRLWYKRAVELEDQLVVSGIVVYYFIFYLNVIINFEIRLC